MVEYLSGGRIQGTDSETRLKNLFANAFTGITEESNSMVGDGDGGTKSDSPIYGQNSLYFDPQPVAEAHFTTYIGGIGTKETTWKDLPKSDFSVSMWLKMKSGTGGNQAAEAGYEGGNNASPVAYGGILGNVRPYGSGTQKNGNGFGIGIQKDGTEEFVIHMGGGGTNHGLYQQITTGDCIPHDDDWHFYVFAFENSKYNDDGFKIYRDAVNAAIFETDYDEEVTDDADSTYTFDIGRQANGNGQGLRQCFVCDVGIWNKILSTDEQDLIYSNHVSGTTVTSAANSGKNIGDSGVDTANCLVWWKMGDHAGAGVSDGFPTSAVASTEVPITDVPIGTRLEVTDTKQIFRMASSTDCTGLSGATPSITTGVIRSTKLTASASATITSIQATLTSVGGNVILSIYSDDSDSPDALVATTGSVTQVEGLNNYDLTTPYAVTASTDYWIAIQVDANISTIGGLGASNANTYASQSYTAPSTFPSPSIDDTGFQFCIYPVPKWVERGTA